MRSWGRGFGSCQRWRRESSRNLRGQVRDRVVLLCLAGPVAGVREKPSESHAAERRNVPTTRNGGSRHLDLKSINSIFTFYVFVIISECNYCACLLSLRSE